jgi:hypothetical protein
MLISFENLMRQPGAYRPFCQCHALMPMMQFSVAPCVYWMSSISSIKKALNPKKFIPVILNLARESQHG